MTTQHNVHVLIDDIRPYRNCAESCNDKSCTKATQTELMKDQLHVRTHTISGHGMQYKLPVTVTADLGAFELFRFPSGFVGIDEIGACTRNTGRKSHVY